MKVSFLDEFNCCMSEIFEQMKIKENEKFVFCCIAKRILLLLYLFVLKLFIRFLLINSFILYVIQINSLTFMLHKSLTTVMSSVLVEEKVYSFFFLCRG